MSESTPSNHPMIETIRRILPQLQQAAEQGNPEAQYHLAMLYGEGEGVALDYVKAGYWCHKASEQNHVKAMRTLAWLYANGYGFEQSDEKAGSFYQRLAELGDSRDQYFLGMLYSTGRYNMPIDIGQTLYWYQQSAHQGHVQAQYALAKLALEGKGVEQDNEVAFQWLSLASSQGHKKATEELKTLLKNLPEDEVALYKQRMLNQY